jgi:hypothetical protein
LPLLDGLASRSSIKPLDLRTPRHLDTNRAYSNNVLIHHHISKAAIVFKRMLDEIIYNCFFFPIFQPKITANETIMLIGFSITLFPVLVFASSKFKPEHNTGSGYFCFK